ncbi:hypothetical protein NKI56_05525 [Mesorhizobium sp. M0622]|uniref:hypothetical protein n=1 Tax=unclassified Mesorhizobium TaxID=325217 RepID=UPI00333E099A
MLVVTDNGRDFQGIGILNPLRNAKSPREGRHGDQHLSCKRNMGWPVAIISVRQ